MVHLPTIGYHRAALVMYLATAGQGPEAPLDVPYALRKLKRWMAEGPTERNRKMAQFILKNGHLGPHYGYGSGKRRGMLSEDTLLLIDLAVEWNDFAMWAGVLKKSGADKSPQTIGSAPLIRAWNVFPFSVARQMLVSLQLPQSCSIPCTQISNFPCRFENIVLHQPNTRSAVEFIHALRASPLHDQQDVAKWCAQCMVTILSSIKEPSLDDVKVFVNIAKTEGLTFFSDTCVQADTRS